MQIMCAGWAAGVAALSGDGGVGPHPQVGVEGNSLVMFGATALKRLHAPFGMLILSACSGV